MTDDSTIKDYRYNGQESNKRITSFVYSIEITEDKTNCFFFVRHHVIREIYETKR